MFVKLLNVMWVCLVLLLVVLSLAQSYNPITYDQRVLHELAGAVASRVTPMNLPSWVPTRNDSWTAPPDQRRHRRRGRKGGVRQRVKRRGQRPPLPILTLSNLRSVRNKIDEIRTGCKYFSEFRDSSILCFTETWLSNDIPNDIIDIDGFDILRLDRSQTATNKSKGGGICMYVNKRWCQNFQIKKSIIMQRQR